MTPPRPPSSRPLVRASTALGVVAGVALVLSACGAPASAHRSGTRDDHPRASASTTVAAPGDGTIDDTAAPAPTPVATVDAQGVTAQVDGGVRIRLAGVTSTTVKAQTPGEVSGSAVVVRLTVQNAGSSAASVDSAVVDVVASDGTYGVGTTAGDGRALSGDVAPGASVDASYVFMMPDPRGRSVTVSVSHAAGAPVARFEGTVS